MSKKTREKTDPWKPLAGDIEAAGRAYGQVYREQAPRIAGLQDDTALARQVALQSLLLPSANFSAGEGLIGQTIRGQFLDSNPYLDDVIGNTSRDIADAVNAQFTLAGRYGSGAHAGTLAREIGEMASRARLGNYDAERARQMAALGMVPGYDQSRLAGVQPLLALTQAEAGLPYSALNQYASGVQGIAAPYATRTTKQSGLGMIAGPILQGLGGFGRAFIGG